MGDSFPQAANGKLLNQSISDEAGLIEYLAEEMAQRWREGERPLVEKYLALHPNLCDRAETALELLYEEIHLRQEHGQEICPEDLFERFPQWRRQVQALLECH